MNESPEIKPSGVKCLIRDALARASRYSVRCDYDLNVGLYSDEQANAPECSHEFSGSSTHNVARMLAIGGMIGVGIMTIKLISCIICQEK